MEIWNNPTCSKCASARRILDESGVPYTVRSYLDEPPSAAELSDVLDRLGLQPWDIARTGEARAAELGLADLPHERDTWIALLVANPVLIQRPILVTDDGRAVVGRSEPAVRSVLAPESDVDAAEADPDPADPAGAAPEEASVHHTQR